MTLSIPSPYRFTFQSSGRCGAITCKNDVSELKLNWEISGVGDKDILLAPLDLTHWSTGLVISREEQLSILTYLRAWLDENKTKSDISRPATAIDHSSHCMQVDCHDHALVGSAYCPLHYDTALLK